MGSGSPACNKRHPYHRCQGRTKRLSLRISGTCLCTTHPLWKMLKSITSLNLSRIGRWKALINLLALFINKRKCADSRRKSHGSTWCVFCQALNAINYLGTIAKPFSRCYQYGPIGSFFFRIPFPFLWIHLWVHRCPPSMAKVENGRIRTHTLPYSQPNKRKKNTKVNKKRPAQREKNIENINQRKMNR